MPQAVIPLIIGLASGGLTSAFGGGGGSSSSDAAALAKQQQQQAQQDMLAKQRAIQASLPNAQEQGGGALNAPSLLNLGSVIAGLPGETNTPSGQSALTAFLGLPASGTSTSGTTTGQPQNLVGATYGLSGSQEG
jgi:hypothetical protein